MAPPKAAKAATAATVNGSLKLDPAGGSIFSLNNDGALTAQARPYRGVQLRCEFCGKAFSKASKRPQRFCCTACRVASSREEVALGGVQVSPTTLLRCSLKKAASSKACNGSKADLYPSVIAAPVSVLGPRFPWSSRAQTDAKVLANSVHREIGGTIKRAGKVVKGGKP
jgi:hypothetical protein